MLIALRRLSKEYRMATEVAVADHSFDEAEFEVLLAILERKYDLSRERLLELTELARDEQRDATSLYQFTQLINRDCSASEKFELIKAMWEVAFTDRRLDKYEEAVIRKVADLIYVSHSDFIRAKSLVRP
jgi:uncharacterized tellurite resistance protein B-like protein